MYTSQGGLWFVGGEESSGRATYRRRFRAEIPAVAWADSGQAGSGETPEVEAEPVRFLGRFLVRWSGDSAAAQSSPGGGAERGGARVLRWLRMGG